MHTNGSKGGCFIMSQEKVVKFLLLVVLFYLAVPILSFSGPLMHTLFSIAWTGFAGLILLGLLMKKEPVRLRAVKKKSSNFAQQSEKTVSMGS
jgi:hypothetical protein